MKVLHFHVFNLFSQLAPSRCFRLRQRLLELCGVEVARDVKMCYGVRMYDRFIKIGSGTWMSPEVVLCSSEQGPIEIGRNCDLGHGAWFVSGSHLIGPLERRAGEGFSRPIIIGDGTWVGARALVLGGANIGAGSMIAAGAVVRPGMYPCSSLLAGVPAEIKRGL
jgi:maltose O-acetyltransferase